MAESPFARLDRAINNHFRAYLGPLAPLMAFPVRAVGARMAGSDIAAVAPIDVVRRISPRPLLLIQDGDDRLCPPAETLLLYNAAGAPKQRWIVPGSGHVGAQAMASAEYERRVTQFFDEALR